MEIIHLGKTVFLNRSVSIKCRDVFIIIWSYFVVNQSKNSLSAMAAFLHHCPFLKSAPKPALRRTGAALLSLADRCPIIARQITVKTDMYAAPSQAAPRHWALDQRRWYAQSAGQVAVSLAKSCPFVASEIRVVRASSEVQEDVQQDYKPGTPKAQRKNTTTASKSIKKSVKNNNKQISFLSVAYEYYILHYYISN